MKRNQKINQQDVLNGIEVLKNACVTYKGMKKKAANDVPFYLDPNMGRKIYDRNVFGKGPLMDKASIPFSDTTKVLEQVPPPSVWDKVKNALGNVNAAQWGAGAGGALLTGLATKMFLDRNKEKEEKGAWLWPVLMAALGGVGSIYATNKLGLGLKKAASRKINQQDVLNGINVLKNACVAYKGMKKKAFYPPAVITTLTTVGKATKAADKASKVVNALKYGVPAAALGTVGAGTVYSALNPKEPSYLDKAKEVLSNINAVQAGVGTGAGLITGLATKMFLDRNKEKEEKGAWFWPTLLGLAATAGGTYAANKFNLGID